MTTPTLTRDQALSLLAPFNLVNKVTILGIRGYFEPAGGNKRGIYDDALFLVTPDFFKGYNGNTDPSIARPGIALLQPGVYWYKKGLHGIHHLNLADNADKAIYDQLIATGRDVPSIPNRLLPYWAYRQAAPVTLIRDGQTKTETVTDPDGWPFIDIHHGGFNTTSSEGCQTIYPDQWADIRDHGFVAMLTYGEPKIPYVLIDKPASL